MAPLKGLAFYDLDGTLVSSTVVHQYGFYARHLPSRPQAVVKTGKLVLSIPLLAALDCYSRRSFNEFFYGAYRGMRRRWLEETADDLFRKVLHPATYPGAKALIEGDRAAGFRCVLVTGSLDFALGPVVRHFGFDDLISNRLVFRGGVATGEIEPPLIAEREKVEAMERLCRRYNVNAADSKAYSDSMSDVPVLEAVGHPPAVSPGRRLRRIAKQRAWPVLNLK